MKSLVVLSRLEHATSVEGIGNAITNEEMPKKQEKDPKIQARKRVDTMGGTMKGLVMNEGLLYCSKRSNRLYKSVKTMRIGIPESMIESVLECCHDSMCGAHLGFLSLSDMRVLQNQENKYYGISSNGLTE